MHAVPTVTIGTAIVGVSLTPARMSGQRQNGFLFALDSMSG